MRNAFISSLESLAAKDRRILLLTGDLGFGVLDRYREQFPEQFANVGVAEQNLAGVGAGLALAGYVVFTYSIGNFPTLRCLEQIRNDICYHEANVKIVAVGGGMAYGALGPSHFATEDLAIMRALPGMTVVAPGDPVEVGKLMPQIVDRPGPVYMRLGRAGERAIHEPDVEVRLGEPTPARSGEDVLLLTTGGMLPVAVEAADMLVEDGVSAMVVSVHTLSPLKADAIIELAERFPLVLTCEEHTVVGGLGSAVAEVLMEAGTHTRLQRFGLRAGFPTGVGSQEHMREVNGIGPGALRQAVHALQPSAAQG